MSNPDPRHDPENVREDDHSRSPRAKALHNKKTNSYEKMNQERKKQGYKKKSDRASRGLYDFLDRFDK